MPSSDELLEQAVQLHQGGNLAQAETLYTEILEADPANSLARNLLGVLKSGKQFFSRGRTGRRSAQ